MKLSIRHITVILVFLTGFSGYSQQEILYQHNYINPFIYNPGYAGLSGLTDIMLIRNQKWSDFDGGLTANLLSISTPLRKGNSSLGFKLNNESIGITSKIKAHLAYAYQINLTDEMILQPGVSIGVVDQRIDLNSVVVSESDPIFSNGYGNKKSAFDASFGLFYGFRQFYLGVSVPQLLGNKLNFSETDLVTYQLERQYIFNTGYKFNINDKLRIQPDILAIHSPGLPFHYSTSVIAEMSKIGWVGVTYKSDYAVGTNIGFNFIKNLKVGLAYDLKLNEIASLSNSNNFEIALMYSIPTKQNVPKTNAGIDSVKIEQITKAHEVKDSILNSTIDSLSTEIEIKEMENKVLADENIILKENPEVIYIEKDSSDVVESKDRFIETPDEIVINDTPDTSQQTEPVIENHIKIEQEKTSKEFPVTSIQTQSIKVKDDFFVELLNNEVSPNGYYVVSGSYSTKEKAEEISNSAKKKFPETRIIVNQRNDAYYIVLYYSPDIGGVIEALMLSHSIGHKDFSKAWALNYFKKN